MNILETSCSEAGDVTVLIGFCFFFKLNFELLYFPMSAMLNCQSETVNEVLMFFFVFFLFLMYL